VTGHEKISAFFKKVISRGSLSHAYCFVGPQSVGKKHLAKYLGAELLGVSFAKLSTQPDFVIVEQEYSDSQEKTNKDITVKQIRELRSFLSQSAYLGKYKIAIIDNAEKMNAEAANALLKILEEPSKNTILFLITANETMLPSTVVSRSQVFYFAPVSGHSLEDWLQKIDTKLDKDELIKLSLGSPGKIINWLEDSEKFLTYKKEVERFNKLIGKTFFEKLKIIEDVFVSSEDNVKVKENWQNILALWRLLVRDSELLKNNLADLAVHKNLEQLTVEESLAIEEKILQAQDLLNKNINPRLLIENILLILP